MTIYPPEVLDEDEDNGTMPDSLEALQAAVVGRRIVKVEKGTHKSESWGSEEATIITLDDGTRVKMVEQSDCCAYTEVQEFLLHPEKVDHIITGVGTTNGFRTWHIYADAGDVLQLSVEWSCGNPFYYGYGFEIAVEPA